MSDRSPRLSDEDPDEFAGAFRNPAEQTPAGGLSDAADLYGDQPDPPEDHHLTDEWAERMHGDDPDAPSLADRISTAARRLEKVIGDPATLDAAGERLHTAINQLFDLAPAHPDILAGLESLSDNPSLTTRDGFVEDVERLVAGRAATHNQSTPHPLAASPIAEPNDVSATSRIDAVADRLEALMPPVTDQTYDAYTLRETIDDLLGLAADRPEVVLALERLADNPPLMNDQHFIANLKEVANQLTQTADLSTPPSPTAEPNETSATARIAENLQLFATGPLASDRDPRPVWIDHGEDLSSRAEIPAHVRAAFDQLGESIDNVLDVVTPHGYQMGDERESFLWGLVNTTHHQLTLKDRSVKQLREQIRDLTGTAAQRIREKGMDSASLELEEATHKLENTAAKRDTFERIRDYMAEMYFHHANKVWAPLTSSHVSETGAVASIVDSKEYLRAKQNHIKVPEIPEGTLIAVTGGKVGPDYKTILETLDSLREEHPDMVLAHGNAPGVQRDAAKWAKMRGVAQVHFLPDIDRYEDWKTAIFRRDDAILMARPEAVISFTAPGARVPRMHDQALRRGIRAENHTEPLAAKQAEAAAHSTAAQEPMDSLSTLELIRQREAARPPHPEDIKHPIPAGTYGTPEHPVKIALPGGGAGFLTDATTDLSPASDIVLHPVSETETRIFQGDDKIGFIQYLVDDPDNPHPHHLLHLDCDPDKVHAIAADQDAVTIIREILATHPPQPEPRDQAIARASLDPVTVEHPQPAVYPDLTPSQAFENLIEAALPEDTQLSEETAEYRDDQRHPLKTTLMSRMISAIDSVISSPGGAADQLTDQRNQTIQLEQQDIGSDIDHNQQQENTDKSHYTSSSLDTLDSVRADLAKYYYETTGEHWTPPTDTDMRRGKTITGASAEATNLVERLEQQRYQARLPQGRPIAVTALKTGPDRDTVFATMDRIHAKRPDIWLAHGNATGVLRDVSDWAKSRHVEQVVFRLDPTDDKKSRIIKRDERILAINPAGIIEFRDGEKTTWLAKTARTRDDIKEKILTVDSTPSQATQLRHQDTQERSAAEQQSHQQSEQFSAGMSM